MALIVLSGLPGVGKTTLARALAQADGALHLRIDSIERALREGGYAGEMGPLGYQRSRATRWRSGAASWRTASIPSR